ncbi:hypothetical protein GEMRC1_008453 [Eukaryota sp. GEM-RC1]
METDVLDIIFDQEEFQMLNVSVANTSQDKSIESSIARTLDFYLRQNNHPLFIRFSGPFCSFCGLKSFCSRYGEKVCIQFKPSKTLCLDDTHIQIICENANFNVNEKIKQVSERCYSNSIMAMKNIRRLCLPTFWNSFIHCIRPNRFDYKRYLFRYVLKHCLCLQYLELDDDSLPLLQGLSDMLPKHCAVYRTINPYSSHETPKLICFT